MLVAAVSTQNKLLLGGTALVVIVFSLLASFWFPRRNPDFPGDRRNLFLAVTGILFVAMVIAVELFAIEEEEHGGEEHALVGRL